MLSSQNNTIVAAWKEKLGWLKENLIPHADVIWSPIAKRLSKFKAASFNWEQTDTYDT